MKQKKQLYPELARTIAIIAVVTQHVTAQTLAMLDFWEERWQIAQVVHVLVQWCVPLFLMVSGIFLLNPEKEITLSKIYTTYIGRMLQAIILMVPVHYAVNQVICQGKAITDMQFLKGLVKSLVYSNGSPVYWYLYMMIGLYVYLPIFRLIVKSANKNQLLYFLIVVFLGSCVFRYIQYFDGDLCKPIAHFVKKIKMNSMIEHGYFLFLGYYLSKYETPKKIRNTIYAVAAVGMIVSVYLARVSSFKAGEYIEIWSSDRAPLQYIAAAAVFLFIKENAKKIKEDGRFAKIIYMCGYCSFGVYLIHNMLINILCSKGIGGFVGNPFLTIPLTVGFVFIISMIIVMLLKKVPWIKRWI